MLAKPHRAHGGVFLARVQVIEVRRAPDLARIREKRLKNVAARDDLGGWEDGGQEER
jgi:hypothetical protein